MEAVQAGSVGRPVNDFAFGERGEVEILLLAVRTCSLPSLLFPAVSEVFDAKQVKLPITK